MVVRSVGRVMGEGERGGERPPKVATQHCELKMVYLTRSIDSLHRYNLMKCHNDYPVRDN